MTIIIHPTKKPDGCGDLGFMVNFANILAKNYKTNTPIAIVSEHKDLILALYGSNLDSRIVVCSIEGAREAMQQGELIPSLFIQGPTYHIGNERIDQGELRIPVIYTGEYTDNDGEFRPLGLSNKSASELVIHSFNKGLSVDIVLSGIGDFSNNRLGDTIKNTKKRACVAVNRPTKHSGIFLDDGLIELGRACLDNPKAYREETLKKLSSETREKIGLALTREQLDSENVDYYFFYGHKKESFDAYLNFIRQRQKNKKDKRCVLIVCGDFADKLESKSVIIDEDDASYSGHVSEKSDISMIGVRQIPSSDFRLLLSLAKDLVVVTGDQSFSEAIALHKIPFYELPGHKESFYREFLKELEQFGGKNILMILNMFYNKNLSNGIIFQKDSSQSIIDILAAIHEEALSEELRQFIAHLNKHWRIDHDIIERVSSMPPSQPLQAEIIDTLTKEIERLCAPEQKKSWFFHKTIIEPTEKELALAGLYGKIINKLVRSHMPFPKIVSKLFAREDLNIPAVINDLITKQKAACEEISFPEKPRILTSLSAGPSYS